MAKRRTFLGSQRSEGSATLTKAERGKFNKNAEKEAEKAAKKDAALAEVEKKFA